ncbi:MAG: UDP-N-acetylglucosamine 2-epimerase (non-hydrolyzing), partial [Candidatus Marinimicrobia bacterium]|nr:UDP-N-acetylglucosamine 2-epimerase (non-hydrolyzing) [Candidatus Neomarinimicrobiota bacterium]
AVIKELEKHNHRLESRVCITAQHRGMLDQVLDLFEIRPDYDLNIMRPKQNLFDITTNAIRGLEGILREEKPDIVLVQGDTTTAFISSLAAFYCRISVGHVEAGLRTWNKYSPFPEEVNRRLICVLSDFHFVPTQVAKRNLLMENVDENKIFVTGNTVIDALFIALKKNRKLDIPQLKEVDFDRKRIILVTAHRRETFGSYIEEICLALRELVRRNEDIEIIYPVHLNPNIRKPVDRILGNIERIHLIEPLDYGCFVQLMNRSYLILTDSGGIQEEAPSLGKPVLVLREITERPEAVEAGTVKVVGRKREDIVRVTNLLLDDKTAYNRMARAINPYGDGKAAQRISSVLHERLNEA